MQNRFLEIVDIESIVGSITRLPVIPACPERNDRGGSAGAVFFGRCELSAGDADGLNSKAIGSIVDGSEHTLAMQDVLAFKRAGRSNPASVAEGRRVLQLSGGFEPALVGDADLGIV